MKKLSLLLASIGAGLLLVGGTVATYIVTAADPINVRVSPGSITTDEYGRVVLGWGTNTMHTVQNLDPGEETSVGTIVLAADFTKKIAEETTYTGLFNVSVSNSSVGDHDLRDYLEFKLYKNSVALPNTVGYQPNDNPPVYERDYPATSGETYEIKVTLQASAGDEYYSELLEQAVTLNLNWGAGDSDYDSRNMANVYYAVDPLASNKELYVHIYEGTKVVAAYPGIKMDYQYLTGEVGHEKAVYSASFDKEEFTNFKFIEATTVSETTTYKELGTATKDFDKVPTKPFWDGDSWEDQPTPTQYSYYIRGIIKGQDRWGWAADSSQDLALRVTDGDPFVILDLNAGDKLKVWVNDGSNLWKAGTKDGFPGELDEEGNFVVSGAGNYTVCFKKEYNDGWVDVGDGYYFYIVKNS